MEERHRQHDDAARVAALERYRILDTAPEPAFDDIAALAASLSGASMAAVSFVADERQWFKARVNLPVAETPREVAFCNRVVDEGVPVVVPDARSDVRFATNPLVTGPPHIAFYAGVPVCARSGEVLGTLCVLDDRPLVLSDSQLSALEALARQVEAQLDLRRSLAEAVGSKAAEEDVAASFAVAFEHTPIGMTLVDVEGNYLRVNRAFCKIAGRPPEDILGRIGIDLIAPDRRSEEIEMGFRMLAGELDSIVRDTLLLLPDGSTSRVRINSSMVRAADGSPVFFLSQVEDISRRGEAEDAFTVTQTALEAIISIDRDSRITFWNPSAEAMFGYRAGEVVGAPVTVIIPPELRAGHAEGMARLARGEPPRLLGRPVEVTAQRRSGARFPIEISLARGGRPEDELYTAVIRDITERKEFETRLERRANVDDLTGLATQARFLDEVAALVERGRRAFVLRVDVDDFKVVNDSLGHEAGDFVLTQLARRLLAELGEGDVAARLGGDEFGVLCASDDLDAAMATAGRIAQAMRAPLVVGRRELSSSVSIGITPAAPGQPALDVLRQADTAMHRAKALGRGRTEVFDDRLQQRAVERLDTEGGLRLALEHGHLVLHYQPEVDLASGRVTGAEALVRWEHPQQGLLPPGRFIGVAEETGLIEAVSEWVVGAALRQLARWRDELPQAATFSVAVNLSGRQLADERIVAFVGEALAGSGCPADALVLEVTETAVMSEPETAARVLAGLADLGVRLAIDDFGTGYSSLAYLQRFPLDLLKVDRSFVQGLDTDDGRAIVRAVVSLASGLGMGTVAEGVETAEQLAAVRALGCDIAQGYFMARPLPAKAMADVLMACPTW